MTLEEKKKNEDALKQHGQELKQQLIIMQTKLERAGEMDKVKEDQFAQQENRHKDTVEEFKKAQTELKLQLHDALAKIEAEHNGMKVQEAEVLKQRDVINRLEAKNASLIAELDNTRAQCVMDLFLLRAAALPWGGKPFDARAPVLVQVATRCAHGLIASRGCIDENVWLAWPSISI